MRSFSSSPSTSEVTAELPMFALILQEAAMPMPIGSRLWWWMLAGMIIRPRATSERTRSGSIRSTSATRSIAGVMVPRRAWCIWVTTASELISGSPRLFRGDGLGRRHHDGRGEMQPLAHVASLLGRSSQDAAHHLVGLDRSVRLVHEDRKSQVHSAGAGFTGGN